MFIFFLYTVVNCKNYFCPFNFFSQLQNVRVFFLDCPTSKPWCLIGLFTGKKCISIRSCGLFFSLSLFHLLSLQLLKEAESSRAWWKGLLHCASYCSPLCWPIQQWNSPPKTRGWFSVKTAWIGSAIVPSVPRNQLILCVHLHTPNHLPTLSWKL